MFSQELIQKLKQTNISKDSEKTKERVKIIWQALNREQKREIVALVGLKKTAVYRIFKTGTISIKLVIPISQAADVDPYYLIGVSDDAGKYSDELVSRLLTELGYTKLLNGYQQKPQRIRRKKVRNVNEENANETEVPAAIENAPEIKDIESPVVPPAVDESGNKSEEPSEVISVDADLTEDEMILLLKSLLLRARLNVADAREQAEKIKNILLS